MRLHRRATRALPAVLCFFFNCALAQTPVATSTVDASPLYVVTYMEAAPAMQDQAAALLKDYRDASRATSANLRSIVLRSVVRPGQFVVVSTWKDKAAWDAHLAAASTVELRDRLAALRSAPADDRLHGSLSMGPLHEPEAQGAVYVVTHVDVVPPRREDAVAALQLLGPAIRNSSGNLLFEVVQQSSRPNHFTLFEIWRSRAAFDAKVVGQPQREFREKLGQMTGALYDERLYELLD
jgi:quinol monooxygenase YgiN